MQCVVIPTTGVAKDRRRLLHWAEKFNESNSNVGGVLTLPDLTNESHHDSAEDDQDTESSRYLKSVLCGEKRLIKGSELEVRELYSWAREEILCSFKAEVCQVVLFGEMGPEIYHNLGLDAAVKACLSEAKDTNIDKVLLMIADPSVADYLPKLYYKVNPEVVWKRYPTFEYFLRADLPVRPTKIEYRLFSWNVTYWEKFGKQMKFEKETKREEHVEAGTGVTYSLTKIPLLVISVGIVLFELFCYVLVRQIVIISERFNQKNRAYHKRLKASTHQNTWKRVARELDVLESKPSGTIEHVPSLHQFSESLAGLHRQLRTERIQNRETAKPSKYIPKDRTYRIADATLSCLLECSSSVIDLVNEQLYSSNYSGRNIGFKHFVENFINCVDEISLIKKPKSKERLEQWYQTAQNFAASNHNVVEPIVQIDSDLYNSKLMNVKKQLTGIGTADNDSADAKFNACKRVLFSELSHRYGEAALLLSGGAANAYYHLGVIKCLHEEGLLPRHFSGASGGALVGSFVCTKTDEELKAILRPDKISKTFDPCEGGFLKMFQNLWKMGTCFDEENWTKKMVDKICGNFTFKEAYERTGRTLTITVYNIDAKNHTRCLNYKTAPDVLIYSAVLASSALPKLLPAIELSRKDSEGNIKKYHAFGRFFRDGSFQNELPVEVLKQHFNVKFTIVSMVEPHISPFFFENRGSAGNVVVHRGGKGWRGGFILSFLERLIKFDIKKWLEIIRDFKLMPKIYETDMNSLFLGRTRGVVTTAVPIYLWSYLNIVRDPNTHEKAEWYLQTGQKMIYPKLEMIKDHMNIEKRLRDALK